jgi:hypothetical protein
MKSGRFNPDRPRRTHAFLRRKAAAGADPATCKAGAACPKRARAVRLALLFAACALSGHVAGHAAGTGDKARNAGALASFAILDRVAAAPAPNAGAVISDFGGGAEFSNGGDFEPLAFRTSLTAVVDAPADAPGLLRADVRALSQYFMLREGALDGADVTVFRLENGRLHIVRDGRIPPGGFHASGWIPTERAENRLAPDTRAACVPLPQGLRPGTALWLTVRAMEDGDALSPTATPVRALPADPRAAKRKLSRITIPGKGPAPVEWPGAATLSAPRDAAAIPCRDGVGLSWRAPERGSPIGYLPYLSTTPPDDMRGFGIDLGDGPRLRAGDLAIVRAQIDDLSRAHLISDYAWDSPTAIRAFRPAMLRSWPEQTPGARWRLHLLTPTEGAAEGSRAALALSIAPGGRQALSLGLHGGTGQSFYPVLRPGAPYVISAWIRANREGRGALRLGAPYDQGEAETAAPPAAVLPYGLEWRQVDAKFVVPYVVTGAGGPAPVSLIFDAPRNTGLELEIDDLRLRREAAPWQALDPEELARLRAFAPSALRTHGLTKTGLTSYDLAMLTGERGFSGKRNQYPSLPPILRLSQDVSAAPWLQIEPHLSDAEWLGLVEYLAAPFDPATDDPAARPWAALRVAQGRSAPWSEAFGRIWLELGNETWNDLMSPWVFAPMIDAKTGKQVSAAVTYGAFQARVAALLRRSAWWGPAGLEDKIGFVIGGHARFDYGEQAARAAGPAAADMLAIAAYNGGWDEDEGPASHTPGSFFNLLNQVSQSAIPAGALNADQAAALSRAWAVPLMPGVYEAGPGYAMNGLGGARVSAEAAHAQEETMKSRAGAAATLDSFLARRLQGYGPQMFFTFNEGVRWSSHAIWHAGGAPYPAWTLLEMMNRELGGEMLAVDALSVPRVDLAAVKKRNGVRDAPLIGLYAIRAVGAKSGTAAEAAGASGAGGDRLSLVAISRRTPGYPDPQDAGCTQLRITLADGMARGVMRLTLRRTGGAYDDHGADGAPPPLETLTLDPAILAGGVLESGAAAGTPDCGLPPGSAYVWTLERG